METTQTEKLQCPVHQEYSFDTEFSEPFQQHYAKDEHTVFVRNVPLFQTLDPVIVNDIKNQMEAKIRERYPCKNLVFSYFS